MHPVTSILFPGGAFLPHGFCEDCLKERYPEMAGTLLTEKT